MGNYNTQFSVAIQRVSDDESTWLREHLSTMERDEGHLTFAYELEDSTLSCHSDEQLDDSFLEILQEFFRTWRLNEYLFIEYANTADHPYLDAFGGGTVFVSAHSISWSNDKAWQKDCIDTLTSHIGGPVRMADEKN